MGTNITADIHWCFLPNAVYIKTEQILVLAVSKRKSQSCLQVWCLNPLYCHDAQIPSQSIVLLEPTHEHVMLCVDKNESCVSILFKYLLMIGL